jgi:hypothetical protein
MSPVWIVSVLDDGKPYDTFDVVEVAGDIARVRSPFLFEIGEELAVRVEASGQVYEAQARVRAHAGPADHRVTELELSEQTEPRRAQEQEPG